MLPALTAVLAGLTWLLVGRALRPVETLRRQAAVITATDLHRRVDVPPSRDELSRLAATLNDLLGGLEASMRRQREFVADAAHELRSPVAALLAQHELRARQTQVAGDQARPRTSGGCPAWSTTCSPSPGSTRTPSP